MAIDFRGLSREQLLAIRAGDDKTDSVIAADELDRRADRKRFWRNFLFPNLWAIAGLALSLFVVLTKHSERTETDPDVSRAKLGTDHGFSLPMTLGPRSLSLIGSGNRGLSLRYPHEFRLRLFIQQ
jgi:hypothetical protein